MICVACQQRTEATPCSECGEEPRLDGRISLLGLLGAGAIGTTWRAAGERGPYAVKELALRRARDSKRRELIEREIRVLGELDHAAVPRLHEVIETGRGRGRTLWLVLDLVDGAPLDRVWPGPAPEHFVLDVLARVGAVLADLHALRPPVVHRDIKPANLLQRPDGSIALVDFGSVKDAVAAPGATSTVVGTFGYTAPEQLQGESGPVSDLYALGATAVHLLAGQAPHRLLDRAGHLRWRDAIHVSVGLGALLDDLLEANPAERIGDARRVVETARWLAHVSARPGSHPPQTRSVSPAPVHAPRQAEPLVGMLRDAYEGKAPARPFKEPAPANERYGVAADELPFDTAVGSRPPAATARPPAPAAALGVGALWPLVLVIVAVVVAIAMSVGGATLVMLRGPGAGAVPSGPPSGVGGADVAAVLAAHPGSLAARAAACADGPGRPPATWVRLESNGTWSAIPNHSSPEQNCVSAAIAGGLRNVPPRGTPTPLYVPLILDGTSPAGDWFGTRTTDGVGVMVDIRTGAIVAGGAPVSVDDDGHLHH